MRKFNLIQALIVMAWLSAAPWAVAQVQVQPVGPSGQRLDDGAGNMNVNIKAGGGTGGTASTFGAASPATGTAAGARDTSGNMQPLALDGAGTGKNLNVNMQACGGCASTGAAVPATASYTAGNGSGNLTGVTVCDKWAPINQTANATIITGVAAKKTYICSINIVTATAQNIALIEGTGAACVTTQVAGLAGGTTAATGWNLSANGGVSLGNGIGIVAAAVTTAADNVCLMQSGAGQTSGVASYTQY